jgi:hypothetical protein
MTEKLRKNRPVHSGANGAPRPEGAAAREAQGDDLDAVILMTRSAMGYLVTMLETGASHGPEPCLLTAEDYVLLIGLVLEGVSVIADLFEVKHSLSAWRSPVTPALYTALNGVSAGWSAGL